MEPEELLNKAKNPNNIPGVYNYCDRWCERCKFTSRCLNFEMSQEEDVYNDKGERDDQKVLEIVSNNFKMAGKMLEHIAKEKGIDLNALDQEAVDKEMARHAEAENYAKRHPASKAAMEYMDSARAFFESERTSFEEKMSHLKSCYLMGIRINEVEKEAAELKDCLEVIGWHHIQIWVKLIRAISGKHEGEDWQEENGFPKDSDGSAKVALIAMDDSITAWQRIADLLPDKTDDIIHFLALIENARRETEEFFPNARSFVRPGFDEPQFMLP